MPKSARVAYVLAFALAGLSILSAFRGQIVLLPFAVFPLIAGIGILRKRAWSAYGFALCQIAQLLLFPLLTFRTGGAMRWSPDIIAGTALLAVLGSLFFLAGRSLAKTGAERGRAWPWILLSLLITLPLIFVQAFVIPTGTMENTLLIGDHILVRRLPRSSPCRDDVFVFVYPIDRRQTFVKRIVGIPGDRIKISEKIVYRNGVAVHEPYALHKSPYPDSYRDNFPSEPSMTLANAAWDMLRNHVVNGEVVVPDRKYFVLGDNRDNSLDSRYWGFVGDGDLIGKPFLIYDSEDQPSEEPGGGRSTGVRRIRWNRMFKAL
jgi:signal peptidase I